MRPEKGKRKRANHKGCPYIADWRHKLLWQRYWKTVVAVLGGNLVYFVLLSPHLPPVGRHRRDQFDWGLIVDFWVCLAVYGLLSLLPKTKRK